MKKKIKEYFILLLTIIITLALDYYVVPVLWAWMNEATTSFMANLYGTVMFISLLPNLWVGFLAVIGYENYYKRTHHAVHNGRKTTWVKNK